MKKITFIMLFIAVNVFSAMSQNNFVEGKILNDGKPAKDIFIKTSFSNRNTTTDKRGNFKIRNIQTNRDTLFIELDEERTLKVALDGNNSIRINMHSDSILIERNNIQVLRPAFGGTIVSRKELLQGGDTDLLRAISNKVTGVQYINGNLIIRGAVSIRGRNTPLYVINGMSSPVVPTLSIWDVESVEVVKGPSAAMFGSEGAAGVVVINLQSAR